MYDIHTEFLTDIEVTVMHDEGAVITHCVFEGHDKATEKVTTSLTRNKLAASDNIWMHKKCISSVDAKPAKSFNNILEAVVLPLIFKEWGCDPAWWNIYHMSNIVFIIILQIILSWDICFANNSEEVIFLKDKSQTSGIDFVHYAPRPRWCEIGPSVVGAATNEGLSLVSVSYTHLTLPTSDLV